MMMDTQPLTLADKEGQPFTIRRYTEHDRADLESMYAAFEPKRCAQGLPAASVEARARWLDMILTAGHHMIVERDRTVLGHGMLIPIDARSAELANFLHQDVRNRGIGTELNRELLDLGRGLGFDRIWLSVEPSNYAAIRSYEKVGFRRRAVTGWSPELEMEINLLPAG